MTSGGAKPACLRSTRLNGRKTGGSLKSRRQYAESVRASGAARISWGLRGFAALESAWTHRNEPSQDAVPRPEGRECRVPSV